jgi:hypothetical protein
MYFKPFKMSKKMKSPENIPPAQEGVTLSNGNANAPTLDVAKAALTGMELEATAPKLSPPETKEGVTAFGAAVWQTDKRVNGLYTTHHTKNSWMSIAGTGWKKLTVVSDSSCEAMTALASHCREKNCRIDYAEDGGVITEIYVW